jgi:GT2 family glycosyltransferase
MDSIQSAKVGVVTVTYGSSQVIDEFMTSMLEQDHTNYILYIIDNASSDDTLAKLAQYKDDRIVVIPNKDNVGIAVGNNQGIQKSIENDCSHVLLINNDTVFDKTLISKLILGLNEHKAEMVTPKIFYFDEPTKIWSAGGYFEKMQANAGKHYGIDELDKGQYDFAKQVSYSSTCCLLIKVDVFKTVGVMDEKYFVYYDDIDFCYRASTRKVIMHYIPGAVLFHKVSSLTGGESSLFAVYYAARNRIYYIRKNLPFYTQPLWLVFCQLGYLMRLIIKRDNLKVFLLKQKSFWEGIVL